MDTNTNTLDPALRDFTVKTDPRVLENFQWLSQQHYQGDEAATFREAVQALTSLQQKRDTSRLKTIIDKIRSDIEAAGGLTSAQIDQLVRESRARRKAARK